MIQYKTCVVYTHTHTYMHQIYIHQHTDITFDNYAQHTSHTHIHKRVHTHIYIHFVQTNTHTQHNTHAHNTHTTHTHNTHIHIPLMYVVSEALLCCMTISSTICKSNGLPWILIHSTALTIISVIWSARDRCNYIHTRIHTYTYIRDRVSEHIHTHKTHTRTHKQTFVRRDV